MSLATIITPAILDKIIGLLVPLFLTSAGGDRRLTELDGIAASAGA